MYRAYLRSAVRAAPQKRPARGGHAQYARKDIVFVLVARVALVLAMRVVPVARTLIARRIVTSRVNAIPRELGAELIQELSILVRSGRAQARARVVDRRSRAGLVIGLANAARVRRRVGLVVVRAGGGCRGLALVAWRRRRQ